MAPIGAAFIPAALVVVGYIQSLLAGRIEAETKTDQVAQSEPQAETKPEPVDLPTARVDDFRRVLDRLNGQRSTLDAERLADELAADGLGLPSGSTVKRWLKEAHQ